MDTTLVACVSDSGPLGNIVSTFCRLTKLMDVQPVVAPNDMVSKFAAKSNDSFISSKTQTKFNQISPQSVE